ncbi:MAG: DegT/DnrJ/EryC1/StrS family aminotransferase [Aquabacterium sp.]|uniref:DegT/DnrJ/EryC1/StrS family aminotransferase n=1 Tax=Aquabacterium sp. TaxID=1872578 RepID=UPI0025C43382|nr:DegT/DnrJ/EryC1/StrS family aminotransferase [Aquabacterium sp.]MBI5924647.1 DegT/DnrJ/EryC1/StrS family aminotransferase [Aquabacterium sp.]
MSSSSSSDNALPFLPFALPEIGEEEIAEVVDTLRSGWVTTGPKARKFEQAFTAYLVGDSGDDTLQSIAVNSATAGLHLALEALGIGPGDEVITTTHTFTATAEVVRYLGADVKLVDIDPATLNIDPAAIEAMITPRTKAIMPVHYAGLSVDMDAIFAIAKKHNLKIVEDAAHALPTTYKQQLIGTLQSDAVVFSFYANKTMTTGEGGMLVTRDPQLAARAKVMRLHGINRDAFDRFTAKVPSWYYEIVAPGFKYNLTDIAAALGLHQLQRVSGFQVRREQIASRFDEALADLPLILPPRPRHAGDLHSWHLYVVRLSDEATINRDQLIDSLFADGIGVSVHYIPLHLHPYWKDRYDLKPEQFSHSQKAYERMVTLPLYTKMTDDDVERVIKAVRKAFGKA